MKDGVEVVGVDNLNSYYDPRLKEARLARLLPDERFNFVRADIGDRAAMSELFSNGRFDRVVHLAAQAGVRYSLSNPHAYVDANISGFLNILEGCRHSGVEHLVFASSSSVYGANTELPFRVTDNVDHPVSLYAATKKANELMAHTYSHLFGVRTTGLRFFTVYGPWGRPDMSMYIFTRSILEGTPIDVFNEGKMRRDFTYVDDIVEGVVRVMEHLPTAVNLKGVSSRAPYRLYNIGNSNPVGLMDMIATLEMTIGKTAKKCMKPLQAGDVPDTYADVDDLERDLEFRPKTDLKDGVARFVEWFREYHV
jgi:UDP-glucuronate 4-epimerase